MIKVSLHWMFDKDVGYYVWTAIDEADKNNKVYTGKTRCADALAWCERHNLDVVDVCDLGTRR